MKRFYVWSWGLFLCIWIVIPTKTLAQQSDNHKRGLKVGIQISVSGMSLSLQTKDGYQNECYRDELPYQYPTDYIVEGYRITDVHLGSKWTPCLSLGISFDKYVTERLAVRIAPSFSFGECLIIYEAEVFDSEENPIHDWHGTNISHQTIKFNDKTLSHLEAPVLLKYDVLKHLYVFSGINPKFRVNGLNTIFNRMDVAAEVGLGVNIYKRLGLQVKISWGLMNRLRETPPTHSYSFYTHPLETIKINQLGLTITF